MLSRFLIVISSIPISVLWSFAQPVFHSDIIALAESEETEFPFGVASGDPTPNSVLLWTKVFPKNSNESVMVGWQIATDTLLKNVVGNGAVSASPDAAFTVQVDVSDLTSGATYFYRFFTSTDTSAIGRTKTASTVGDALKFAVASCSDYQHGYFTAYAHMAKQNDLDAVLFLGDYIYEYGPRSAGNRKHIPPHETISLQDYRSRYAQYRLDSNLQEVHRLHPFITIWDDHEVANNSFKHGAERHVDSIHGKWEVRKGNAVQAYYEWIPMRRKSPQSGLYRSLQYGDFAELFMIDGRLEGRDAPVENYNSPLRFDTSRTALGYQQRSWLLEGIANSTAQWRILLNNVMFSTMDFMVTDRKFNMDAWDGYVGDRNRIFDMLEEKDIRDLIIVTGDIHTSWAIDLTRKPLSRKDIRGAEFVTPSISSKNFDEYFGVGKANFAQFLIKNHWPNRHVRYIDVKNHGYFLLELNELEAKATWIHLEDIQNPMSSMKPKKTWSYLYRGNDMLERNKRRRLKRVKP